MPDARPEAPEQRRAAVIDTIATTLCVDDRSRITDAATLTELGADSLDAVEIACDLEEAIGISVDLDELTDLASVGALVAAVEREAGRG